MPTYSYRCADCDHRFDAVQRFADDPLRECPACGGPIRRVIQPVGVVFKGSGWYINDSRQGQDDGKKAPKPGADDKAAADKTPSDTTPGDKPATESKPVAAEATKPVDKVPAAAGAKAAD